MGCYVLKVGGREAPTVEHDGDVTARKEAERLAAKHPGETFQVLNVIASVSCSVSKPTWAEYPVAKEPRTTEVATPDVFPLFFSVPAGASPVCEEGTPAVRIFFAPSWNVVLSATTNEHSYYNLAHAKKHRQPLTKQRAQIRIGGEIKTLGHAAKFYPKSCCSCHYADMPASHFVCASCVAESERKSFSGWIPKSDA